jgi:hypothetical protein
VALETTNRNAEMPLRRAGRSNPFDYLTELQRHSEELKPKPSEGMPWNYREKMGDAHRRLITGFMPGGKKHGQAGASTQNGGKRPFVWQRADLKSRGRKSGAPRRRRMSWECFSYLQTVKDPRPRRS